MRQNRVSFAMKEAQVQFDLSPIRATSPARTARPPDSPLMVQARALETRFLAEMLGHAGLDKAGDQTGQGFDGGIGEEQFASFLREEQARQMVAQGGLGLAEQLFTFLQKAQAK